MAKPLEFIVGSWNRRPGAARTERLKQQFAANAPKADGAVLALFGDDLVNGFFDDVVFGLSCLQPKTPVHFAIFPTDNDMGLTDYLEALQAAVTHAQAADMVVHGARLAYMINSVVPGGCVFGLPEGETLASLGLTIETLASEVDDAATLLLTAMPDTAVLSFPIFQPGTTFTQEESAQLRVAARSQAPDRVVIGQMVFPDDYENPGPILSFPPCFTQLPTIPGWRPLLAQARQLDLLWIERHQDQWPA